MILSHQGIFAGFQRRRPVPVIPTYPPLGYIQEKMLRDELFRRNLRANITGSDLADSHLRFPNLSILSTLSKIASSLVAMGVQSSTLRAFSLLTLRLAFSIDAIAL